MNGKIKKKNKYQYGKRKRNYDLLGQLDGQYESYVDFVMGVKVVRTKNV